MLPCLYNRSSQTKLLETDKAHEVFNRAEIGQTASQTFSFGSITYIWDHCNCTPGKCFLKISLKYFPKHSARLV